ncbi:MAG: rod shape-determining protein MreD [Peptostreptococcaceae bacterium]|nr:rod shape-determining protein MreD [Peptostreptococcaceae bacterium]
MKNIIILIVGIFIAILTATVLNFFDLLSQPDFLMIFIFLVCLYSKSQDTPLIIISLVLGIIYDILIARYQGFYSISFFLTAVALTYLKNKLLRDKLSAVFFVCFTILIINAIYRTIFSIYPYFNLIISNKFIISNIQFILSNSIVLYLALLITIKAVKIR